MLTFVFRLFFNLFILLSPFIASCIGWHLYWRFAKKMKPIKGEYRRLKHGWKIKRLLWDFPRQLTRDKLARNPDHFREYGVHVVAGKQGSGKTVTLAYLFAWYKKQYPKLKIMTNFAYKHQDGVIRSWRDIIGDNNGIYGEIIGIDELQNWFNSLQSKDFPLEMMTEITQQRKQRKMILATSQVFERVAKPIREQTYMLYKPFTIAGCLTVVFKFEVIIKSNSGSVDKNRFRGAFFFVHNRELRESFDTYHKIEQMKKEGFKPSNEHLSSGNVTVNTARRGIFGRK
jgi:ATP-dependent Clp protease ATP-binding subunit ClpX